MNIHPLEHSSRAPSISPQEPVLGWPMTLGSGTGHTPCLGLPLLMLPPQSSKNHCPQHHFDHLAPS